MCTIVPLATSIQILGYFDIGLSPCFKKKVFWGGGGEIK